MTFLGNLSKDTTASLSAGVIAALASYFIHGNQPLDILGMDIPSFIIQGASVSGSVFITNSVSSHILPTLGLHPLATSSIYLAEPAITGISSASIIGLLTGFDTEFYLKDVVIGLASHAGGQYVSGVL